MEQEGEKKGHLGENFVPFTLVLEDSKSKI